MTSSRGYLMRAIYEWIVDNECTPYVLVDAIQEGVSVPQQYVQDDRIVLNIAPQAVMNLDINNEALVFSARFSGVETFVFVPLEAVVGIYARENGQGMLFETEDDFDPPMPPDSEGGEAAETSAKPKIKKPSLKIVK